MNDARSAFHRTADGTIWGFLAEAVILPTGLISAAYLARALGPDGYGMFSLAATLVSLAGVLAAQAFSRGSIKLVSEAAEWQPVATTVARLHLLGGAVAMAAIIALAWPLARALQEPRLAYYLILFSPEPLLFVMARAHRSILIGVGRFREQAVPIALRPVARLLLIVVLVESGLSITGAVLGMVGAALVEFLTYRWYIRPRLFPASSYPARRVWSQATPLFFSGLCLVVFGRLDLFAIRALGLPMSEAGYYAAAQNLSVIPGLFAASFGPVLLSTLSSLKRGGEHHRARLMMRDAVRLVFGMLPFAAMASGAAGEIVTLIFGATFTPAEPVLAWLIFGKVAAVMTSIAIVIMIVADRPGLSFSLAAPMLGLAVVGHLVMIPAFGVVGAASVTSALEAASAVAALAVVYRLQHVAVPVATVGRTLLVGSGAWLLAAWLPAPGLWPVAKLAAIALVIVVGYWLLGELSERERAWGRTMLRWPVRSRA
jgi:O-antigen/teichoic acid export membrane protein